MAYGEDVKLRAFRLYVIHGRNAEDIAETLRVEYPKLSSNTVREWTLRERDAHTGQTWDECRSAVDARTRQIAVAEGVKQRTVIAGELRQVREKLISELLGKAPEAKSLEGLAYAVKGIAEAQLRMEQNDNDIDPLTVVSIILEVLSKDREVAALLKKRWHSINSEIATEIKRLSNAREV